MKVPDWRTLALDDGVVPEPVPEENHIALWVRGERAGAFQQWERISTVARAPVTAEGGLCAVPATAVRARQRLGGFFGKVMQPFRRGSGPRSWALPDGGSAEQEGDREADLMLVRPDNGAGTVDEATVRSRWPRSREVRRLGPYLFLVAGAEPVPAGKETAVGHPPAAGKETMVVHPPPAAKETMEAQAPAPVRPASPQRQLGEQLLAAARQAGDRRREMTALTDLGYLAVREGDPGRAVALLEEALAAARQVGDRAAEGDALGYLGLAAQDAGDLARATAFFEQHLALARAAGDRFAQKIALDRMGKALAALGDPGRACPFLEQALALAVDLDDRLHQAELLWYLAIQEAELGRRDQALARAEKAVDLLGKVGSPAAGPFAEHLEKFRREGTGGQAGTLPAPQGFAEGPIVASGWSAPAAPPAAPAGAGPGLLRMALSAVNSMARFVGSGLKLVPAATHDERLRTCAACEHHTGLRCRLCGCFTAAKSWLPHEDCPIKKWPT